MKYDPEMDANPITLINILRRYSREDYGAIFLYLPGDGGAKLGHWSGGAVSPHRRCKTLPVVRLGPFDLGGAWSGDVFCGGLQRGSSFRIH